jgi:Tetratricopeptide repeat
MKRTTYISTAIIVIIVVLAVFAVYHEVAKRHSLSVVSLSEQGSIATSTQASASTTVATIGGITVGGTGKATITMLPDAANIPVPSLKRPITFSQGFNPDAEQKMTTGITYLESVLSKDPTSASSTISWLELGVDREIIGDYQGADQAWEYVSKLYPTEEVAWYDLGDLHTNYLKDYPRAESEFETAISLRPSDTNAYMGLFTLYEYSYKVGTTAAADTLIAGIKATNSVDLMTTLAGYYADKGDTSDALKYYNQALAQAVALKNTALQSSISGAIKQLQTQ